jgi:NAD(P)-dependent dehydrogenase (short-subunit alcohol dehydrogenase family)
MAANAGVVLITGANSGIGLEFVKQYAAMQWTVYATHRHETTPQTLEEERAHSTNVRPERMDVANRDEVLSLAQKLRGTPIDVLINNAGIAYDANLGLETQAFGKLDYALGDSIYAVNTLGPLRVTEAFIGHVSASARKKVICISSTNGSLTQPLPGDMAIFYRGSKAALNREMMCVADAVKPQGVLVALLHPGEVATERNLVASKRIDKKIVEQFHLISPTLSVHHMIVTIERLGLQDSGKFFRYDGSPAPW